MLIVHKPKLTPEIIAVAAALAALPDDTIDLSDMAEVTDWSGWTRGNFYRPVKMEDRFWSDLHG